MANDRYKRPKRGFFRFGCKPGRLEWLGRIDKYIVRDSNIYIHSREGVPPPVKKKDKKE